MYGDCGRHVSFGLPKAVLSTVHCGRYVRMVNASQHSFVGSLYIWIWLMSVKSTSQDEAFGLAFEQEQKCR